MNSFQPSPQMTVGSSAELGYPYPQPRRTLAGRLAQQSHDLAPPAAYWEKEDEREAVPPARSTMETNQHAVNEHRSTGHRSNGHLNRSTFDRFGPMPKDRGPRIRTLLDRPPSIRIPTEKENNLVGLQLGVVGRDGNFGIELDSKIIRGNVAVNRAETALVLSGNGFANSVAFQLSASLDSIVDIAVAGAAERIILTLRLSPRVDAWTTSTRLVRFAALDEAHRDKGAFVGKQMLLTFSTNHDFTSFLHASMP